MELFDQVKCINQGHQGYGEVGQIIDIMDDDDGNTVYAVFYDVNDGELAHHTADELEVVPNGGATIIQSYQERAMVHPVYLLIIDYTVGILQEPRTFEYLEYENLTMDEAFENAVLEGQLSSDEILIQGVKFIFSPIIEKSA